MSVMSVSLPFLFISPHPPFRPHSPPGEEAWANNLYVSWDWPTASTHEEDQVELADDYSHVYDSGSKSRNVKLSHPNHQPKDQLLCESTYFWEGLSCNSRPLMPQEVVSLRKTLKQWTVCSPCKPIISFNTVCGLSFLRKCSWACVGFSGRCWVL